MQLSVTGLPALAIAVGAIVVSSLPVWLAARIVGADRPTLWRSALSLALGTGLSLLTAFIVGPMALLLTPLWFLLAFKLVLGTSFFGALALAVLAAAGYAAMVHLIGGGISFGDTPVSV